MNHLFGKYKTEIFILITLEREKSHQDYSNKYIKAI